MATPLGAFIKLGIITDRRTILENKKQPKSPVRDRKKFKYVNKKKSWRIIILFISDCGVGGGIFILFFFSVLR